MYILCFINSHWNLLLPVTALLRQDSSARHAVLGFLPLPHLVSESCFFIQGLVLPRPLCLPLVLRVAGTPTLQMVKSFWDGLLQPLPRSGERVVERKASCIAII